MLLFVQLLQKLNLEMDSTQKIEWGDVFWWILAIRKITSDGSVTATLLDLPWPPVVRWLCFCWRRRRKEEEEEEKRKNNTKLGKAFIFVLGWHLCLTWTYDRSFDYLSLGLWLGSMVYIGYKLLVWAWLILIGLATFFYKK